MYFNWEEFPLISPEHIKAEGKEKSPVIIIGAGPVGLAIALGLSQHEVPSVILERRTTISKGSRALAMTRRSLQILDQLGIGKAVMDIAMPWGEGWTYYGNEMVHYMNIAPPPNERHGQTNLQQCWMEQLLLNQIAKTPLVEVRYGHEVSHLEPNDRGVTLQVQTAAGTYTAHADYLVAADGPRGATRKQLGLDYEGTSYTQQFVINDIICKLPIPAGRRLYFNPPYLPGKAVLMHGAPFDMWRLDFQLLDGQDADEEMQPEKVHARIKAHFNMMGLPNVEYELVLTSIYRTNALSLPTYNRGRVLFAGDAAHQVPIFGGRGVNHGYADAHNLAWKLASVVKGRSQPRLLDTYTQERRGAILDTLAELTKTTLFITTPSPGISLMREAVLSLSITEKFLNNLFDPYASPPFEYKDSALNATPLNDTEFGPAVGVGAIPPDGVTNDSGDRLYDQIGPWFSVVLFSDDAHTEAQGIATAVHAADPSARLLVLPTQSDLARRFDAQPGTTYLLRPDNRVAARWRHADAKTIVNALNHAACAV